MEPVWEDPPVPEAPFFTRDQYDIYSLAPTIRELWSFLQSPVENTNTEQKCDAAAAEASCSPATKQTAEFKDNSCISKQEPRRDRSDSDDQCADSAGEGAEQRADAEESKEKLKPFKDEPDAAYPEPRLPYPRTSVLSKRMQNMYLDTLINKNTGAVPQWLLTRVNDEVMQFMGYLQDVARICADDYNFISHAAMQYSEEFFKACLTHIKTIPHLYQIHEMTSLTGGTFNPELKLTFEKQLLIMGTVDITDHRIVPADTQLASDYQSVSSESPPAKKAKDMHATISSDSNAENLCARYEPHVCLTRDALVNLLDNHGPDFGEPWELPVLVKLNPGKGKSQKKTVYIDSPLLKTEMTVREQNHIYHEESLKQSIKKNGSVKVFHVMTELPMSERRPSPESSQRNVVPFENSGLDFEVDLTDLETFGESTPIKTQKTQKRPNEQQNVCDENEKASCPPLNETKMSNEHLSSSQEEMDTSLTNMDDPRRDEKTNQSVLSETTVPKTEQRCDGSQESDVDHTFTEDSDDEKLVIDDSLISAATHPKSKNTSSSSDPPIAPESVPVNSVPSSPQKVARQRRQSKRAKVSGDQLSEILNMQTAMFSSANDTAKSSTVSQEINSPTQCTGPSVHSHPTSLVKPCVTSYLERNQNLLTPQTSAPAHNITVTEHKKLLSEDLQAGAEDEQDYKAPEEGNLLYKLYSLQDLLLMVRSSIALTHTRKAGNGQNQYVPVHLLPKLEYQLCYGVECLTNSEACQLWTETLLHSSNVSYTAHINAHTSKVALVRKLPDDWKRNISCGFKPAKSLNILHHLLKKLTGLEEGRYLITHKAGEPFVTLLKVANGKVSRGGYNLQQIHSSVPRPPASGLLPWIPVDPSVVLPFHQKHGRVPCTFPLKTFVKKRNSRSSEPNNCGPGQSKNNPNEGGKTKKKKKNRAAKRKQYINKLIQKSV